MTESTKEPTPREKLREQGMQMLREGKAPSEVSRALGASIKTTSGWKAQLGITSPQLRPSRRGLRLKPRGLVGGVVPPGVALSLPQDLSRGQKIRLARTKRGLRQEEAARRADVAVRTLIGMERDDPSVQITVVKKVADLLGVPMADLVPLLTDSSQIHERIRHERLMQGLSLQALADKSGLSYPTVRKVEQNDPTIKESTQRRVIEALGLVVPVLSSDPLDRNDFCA